jgi:hypothetical protein
MNEGSMLNNIIHKILNPHSRDDNGFKLMFCGIGSVAEAGIASICDTPATEFFNKGISDIYIVGSESSIPRRQRLAEQANQRLVTQPGLETRVIPVNYNEMGDLLPDIDLFFLTGSRSPQGETSRKIMLEYNKKMVDDIARYFTKDFKGIINIVSNLPEGLAHYAATVLELNDIRQITAHVPLDLIRYQEEIKRQVIERGIVSGNQIYSVDLMVSGYHDLPWPLINGSEIVLNTQEINEKGQILKKTIGIEILLQELFKQISLPEFLSSRGYMHALLSKMEVDQYKKQAPEGKEMLILNGCCTAGITGKAIMEFAKAVVNRDKTATAIPFKFHDYNRWFFVDMPVTFDRGYPRLDEAEFKKRFDSSDYRMVRSRIIGDKEFDDRKQVVQLAKSVLGEKHDLKTLRIQNKDTLEKVINETFGKECNFTINNPEDVSILEAIFNPRLNQEYTSSSINVTSLGTAQTNISERKFPFKIYYVKNTEPTIICSRGLSTNDNQETTKYKVLIKGDDKYEKRMRIRRIIEYDTKLFAECLYNDDKGDKKSHWVWFDKLVKQTNGGIKPEGEQSFTIDDKPATFLHLPLKLNDTVTVHQNEIYFLIREQDQKHRAIRFNPMNPKEYTDIGTRVDPDEAILAITSLEDDLIFAGSQKFYRLYKDKLKEIGYVRTTPRIIRSIPEERIILYSDGAGSKIYAFSIDSTAKHTELPQAEDFQINLGNEIILAKIINDRIEKTSYSSVQDLLRNNMSDNQISLPLTGLKKIAMLDEFNIAALTQNDSETRLHPLDIRTMRPYGEVITLHNAVYTNCMVSKR